MEGYKSQENLIVAKAKEKGISTAELNKVFEEELREVSRTEERSGGWKGGGLSLAEWRLMRAEEGVWGVFFPGEPFPTTEKKVADTMSAASRLIKAELDQKNSPLPKAFHSIGGKSKEDYDQPPGHRWLHDRYQPESPSRAVRVKVERDSYRPVQQADTYRPPMLGESKPAARSGTDKASMGSAGASADRTALQAMPNESTTRTSLLPLDDSKPYISQRDAIYQNAAAAGISRKDIDMCLDEKVGIAEKRFADTSKDWQMFFVEASTWGRFFKGLQFPGSEPSKHQTQTNLQQPQPKPCPLSTYGAQVSEKLMEGKTTSQAKRREFFQYLQKMRTYARLQHPTEACNHIRGWFADNLTWQHFYGPDPFPFAQPPGKIYKGCVACLLLPRFAKVQDGTMKKVMQIITAPGPSQGPQSVKILPAEVPKAPAASRSNESDSDNRKPTVGELTITSKSSVSGVATREPPDGQTIVLGTAISKPTGPIKPFPSITENYAALPTAGNSLLTSTPTAAPISRRDMRTPPPTSSRRSAPELVEFNPQSVVSSRLSAQLAFVWKEDPFLGKGTVVMQNNVPKVFNKTFVGELFNCFASDTKQAIAAIGAELKCRIHYCVISTGDLFLWTEPQVPGDLVSANLGHLFLTGWVARVSSFGMVKPSEHWKSIRPPPAALQAQATIFTQPRTAEDALSHLSNYVSAAATGRPNAVVGDRSTELQHGPPGPSSNTEVVFTDTKRPTWSELVQEPQSKPRKLTLPTQSSNSSDSPSFEDPEKEWQRYMVAFRSSNIDRQMVEEAAKNEGNLRMVLDYESGQIVSVGELVKRTIYRCSLKEVKGTGTTGRAKSEGPDDRTWSETFATMSKKRKAEDVNEDEPSDGSRGGRSKRGGKRACF